MKHNILCLIVSSLLALAGGFLPPPELREWAYQNLAWFFMLFATLLLLVGVYRLRSSFAAFSSLQRHGAALVAALLIVVAGFLVSPPEFRILADETNLLGVSLEMHENMKTRLPLEALYYYHGMRNTISYKTEMRPPGYPFALSLLHNISGYRPENAFVLNFLLAWFALVLFYLLVARHSSRAWGIAAMIGLAAFPSFVQCSNSAGFEIFNLALALFVFYLSDLLLSGKGVALPLSACLVLLAHSRYESILALLCFVPIMFLARRFKKETDTFLIWTFPVLLMPAFWLRSITWDTTRFQVDDIENAFSVSHIMPNLAGFVSYFTDSGLTRFAGPFLLALAVIGFLLWLKDFLYSDKPRYSKLFELSLAAFFLLHLAARLMYTQGNPLNAYTARLTVILQPALVLLAVYALKRLESALFRDSAEVAEKKVQIGPGVTRAPLAAVAVALMFVLLVTAWPLASGNRGVNSLVLFRECKWVREQLQKIAAGEESIVVCERPNMYVPLKYSAVTHEYAQKNAARFLEMLRIKAYDRLILVETVPYSAGEPAASNYAEFSSLRRQVIFETQQTGKEKLKITLLTLPNTP